MVTYKIGGETVSRKEFVKRTATTGSSYTALSKEGRRRFEAAPEEKSYVAKKRDIIINEPETKEELEALREKDRKLRIQKLEEEKAKGEINAFEAVLLKQEKAQQEALEQYRDDLKKHDKAVAERRRLKRLQEQGLVSGEPLYLEISEKGLEKPILRREGGEFVETGFQISESERQRLLNPPKPIRLSGEITDLTRKQIRRDIPKTGETLSVSSETLPPTRKSSRKIEGESFFTTAGRELERTGTGGLTLLFNKPNVWFERAKEDAVSLFEGVKKSFRTPIDPNDLIVQNPVKKLLSGELQSVTDERLLKPISFETVKETPAAFSALGVLVGREIQRDPAGFIIENVAFAGAAKGLRAAYFKLEERAFRQYLSGSLKYEPFEPVVQGRQVRFKPLTPEDITGQMEKVRLQSVRERALSQAGDFRQEQLDLSRFGDLDFRTDLSYTGSDFLYKGTKDFSVRVELTPREELIGRRLASQLEKDTSVQYGLSDIYFPEEFGVTEIKYRKIGTNTYEAVTGKGKPSAQKQLEFFWEEEEEVVAIFAKEKYFNTAEGLYNEFKGGRVPKSKLVEEPSVTIEPPKVFFTPVFTPGIDEGVAVSDRVNVGQGNSRREVEKIKPAVISIPKLESTSITRFDEASKVSVEPVSAEKISQKQFQESDVTPKPRLKTALIPVLEPFEPVEPQIQPPELLRNVQRKPPKTKAFDVDFGSPKPVFDLYKPLVRRGGRFVQVSKPVDVFEALRIASSEVENTAAASLRLERVDSKDSFDDFDLLPLLGYRFRRSKKESNVFVEKRQFRISSPGEVREISLKGGRRKNVFGF